VRLVDQPAVCISTALHKYSVNILVVNSSFATHLRSTTGVESVTYSFIMKIPV
jgi:hypothetical protein